MHVLLKNPSTDEKVEVQVGWSWSLFVFWQYGVPLFNRRLTLLGRVGVSVLLVKIIISLIDGWSGYPSFFSSFFESFLVGSLNMLFIGIYFGRKGNELQAKQLLENGWVFSNETLVAVRAARQKWGLAT